MSTNIINHKYIIKLFISLYIAWFLSYQVLAYNYKLLIFILAGFLFLLLFSLEKKFIIFTLTAVFPIMLEGRIGPLYKPKAIEFLAPFLSCLLLLDIMKNKQSFYSKKAFIYFAAIVVITLWSAISFVRHPLVGMVFGGGSEGGLRSYVTIFIGIITFLNCFWYVRYKELDVNKWLTLLLTVSFALGYLQLIGFFADFKVPFLGGLFNTRLDTTELSRKLSKFSYYRIGGLAELTILITALIFTLYYRRKWNFRSLSMIIFCIVLLYFSGGRTAPVCLFVMVLVYVTWLKRNYVIIASAVVVGSLIFIILPNIEMKGQMERIMAFQGGLEKQDKARSDFYRYYWKIFKDNPLLGKGIGFTNTDVIDVKETIMTILPQENKDKEEVSKSAQGNNEVASEESEGGQRKIIFKGNFRESQVALGGHGSYMSMLNLFGIGGAFFMFVMVFVSLRHAYRIFRRNPEFQGDTKLAFFIFLFMVGTSVRYLTGGAGYDSMDLWLVAGIIAGLRAREGDRINEVK